MQATINTQFAENRARMGTLANAAGFVLLIGGFVLNLVRNDLIMVAYAMLIGGFVAFNFGKYQSMRWGRWARLPRADETLTRVLRGLDNKYHLFSYVKGLPVDHLLLTPHGLTVLEVRPFLGEVNVQGDRWKRGANLMGFLQLFTEGSLGSPSRDARRGAEEVSELLVTLIGEDAHRVPVTEAVVLAHPRVRLTAKDPGAPVVKVDELRGFLREQADEYDKLPPAIYRQVAQALEEIAPPMAAPARTRRRETGAAAARSRRRDRTQ